MNQIAPLSLIDRADTDLWIVAQCRLLKVARSMLHWRPAAVSEDDLRLVRWLDEQHLAKPFDDSSRMVAGSRRDGSTATRKRVRRLMRVMRIEAIYQKPNTRRRHPEHQVVPYLFRGLVISRPNQMWWADITYIPLADGFVYPLAVMGWFSRRVVAWRLLVGMETGFCVDALQEVLDRYSAPEIFTTDQGVQFTGTDFIGTLATSGLRVRRDGKRRYLDNILIERLWRGLKHEDIYIKAHASVQEVRRGIGGWLIFLGYPAQREVLQALGSCGDVDNAGELSTSPQATTRTKGMIQSI
jgi:putative transposase